MLIVEWHEKQCCMCARCAEHRRACAHTCVCPRMSGIVCPHNCACRCCASSCEEITVFWGPPPVRNNWNRHIEEMMSGIVCAHNCVCRCCASSCEEMTVFRGPPAVRNNGNCMYMCLRHAICLSGETLWNVCFSMLWGPGQETKHRGCIFPLFSTEISTPNP